nr:hypothetical protein [Anaplasma phagocytophilum]
MSGYAYSGLSSQEYKDSLCRAITTDLMPYSEFLKVLREFVAELRSTFGELREVDAVFAAKADVVEVIEKCITDAESAESAMRKSVLCRLIHYFYDVLQGCVTAPCNQDVTRFSDPRFIRHGVHLQIAKACGILVNAITMANCCAKTVAGESDTVGNEEDKNNAFKTGIALSAYVHTEFSAASRCLNPSASPEETKRRKAILRVLRHNTELCLKVSELISHNILSGFRYRTKRCLNGILNVVESTSAECEAMVHNNDESAYRRLAIAKRARRGFAYFFNAYGGIGLSVVSKYFNPKGYLGVLVGAIGSLFSMHRFYSSTGNADHAVAIRIDHCLRVLFTLYRYDVKRETLPSGIRKAYADIRSVYTSISELRPDLLLNPQAEIRWREAALQYCTEMMSIWKELHERHLDVVEQPDGSPDQPSTSGLGSAGAGIGGSQASSVLLQDHSYAQPSTSWDQPSTSGLGATSSALYETQVASHSPLTSSDDDLEPPSKRSRSA